ncbi:MAG: hypothetical protein AAF513_13740 [Pseudomonadota bacterium]
MSDLPTCEDTLRGREHLRLNFLFASTLHRCSSADRRTFSFWPRYRLVLVHAHVQESVPRPERDILDTPGEDLHRMLDHLEEPKLGWHDPRRYVFRRCIVQCQHADLVISTYLILQEDSAGELQQLARSLGVPITPDPKHVAVDQPKPGTPPIRSVWSRVMTNLRPASRDPA